MFVEQLVEDESQMEGIPADCSQIMNWHVPFDRWYTFQAICKLCFWVLYLDCNS
jgi:hypothetical protein